MNHIIPLLALLIPLAACMTLGAVEEEAQRIQLETQEAINAIERSYFEGTISLEEKERLKAEAIARAQEDIAAIPDEARRMPELERDNLKQRGVMFGMTLLELLLLGLGVPVVAGGTINAMKKKSG